ncbi:hypothetical protein [Demequina salsinemoris]|uniref:hypothetical protein n=1 Tax=Demequina salsinemoris TaxID=577470 RepID=UPI0007810328|nr:hypothetical protein [Demequina salsinemoris]
MGYSISIWDGQTPSNRDDAYEIWKRVYGAGHPVIPPSPRILGFMRMLSERWPDPLAEDAPFKRDFWQWDDAAGNLFDTELRFGRDSEAEWICRAAEREGLVFWDPQHDRWRAPFRARWEEA